MLLGDLIIWYYENLAGIKCAPDAVGYKQILMQPAFPKGLDHAQFLTGIDGQFVGNDILFAYYLIPNACFVHLSCKEVRFFHSASEIDRTRSRVLTSCNIRDDRTTSEVCIEQLSVCIVCQGNMSPIGCLEVLRQR